MKSNLILGVVLVIGTPHYIGALAIFRRRFD